MENAISVVFVISFWKPADFKARRDALRDRWEAL